MHIERVGTRLGFPECKGKFITYPAFVDAKYDGELGIYEAVGNSIIGKNGKQRSKFPACNSLNHINKHLKANLIYGELYYDKGKAGDIYKLLSNYDSDDLKFAIFDYDSDEDLLFRKTQMALAMCSPKFINVHIAESRWVENEEEYIEAFNFFTKERGFEGVVVKNPATKLFLGNNAWVKVKTKSTADLTVVSADEFKERVGVSDLIGFGRELCGVKVPGTSKAERQAMVGKIMEIEYLQKLYNSKGDMTGLRNPIFKRMRPDKTKVSL